MTGHVLGGPPAESGRWLASGRAGWVVPGTVRRGVTADQITATQRELLTGGMAYGGHTRVCGAARSAVTAFRLSRTDWAFSRALPDPRVTLYAAIRPSLIVSTGPAQTTVAAGPYRTAV